MQTTIKHLFSCLALLLLCSCKEAAQKPEAPAKVSSDSQRIISFAPAITEILFALGLGDRVVAVSNFCQYPPEVQSLPKAGGLLDPNLEAIVRLEPDCVIVYGNHTSVLELLERLNIPALVPCGDNLPEIMQTILLLGKTFNRQQLAEKIVADMKNRLEQLRLALPPQHPVPTVMVIAWRERGQGTLKNITVAGNDQFYSEMVTIAGGKLLPDNPKLEYPMIGAEGIMQLNPDLIIEIAPELQGKPEKVLKQTVQDWHLLPELEAVKKQQVFLITDDYAAIPGPRSILLAEKFAAILAPFVQNTP
ncbi:MAG: ABC transporter substrate-binding protein [Lentisphaerae bacterium]|nr:ABC transporter substrate-binding protein [Lentisphaerota bacterium]